MQDLIFSTVSHQRVSLSQFASIQVLAQWPSKTSRSNTVTVQNPTAAFTRKDGKVTIQGANRENTVTLFLTGRAIMATDYNGQTFWFDFGDTAEADPWEEWERILLGL